MANLKLIPGNKLSAVKDVLLKAFGRQEPDHIGLLAGGLSSALVYKLTIANTHYVLRIIMAFDDLNNPQRQYECMRVAAEAGLAPAVFYTDEKTGISITLFINAVDPHQVFPSRILFIRELAGRVKQLHALPAFPKLVDFITGVEVFRNAFIELKMFPGEVTEKCFRQYEKVVKHYPKDLNDLVSSHNDLNPNNILYDGQKLWLIDWEAAFLNDRFVDLAITAQFFTNTEQETEELLRCYFASEISDFSRAKFFLMQQVCYMYYAMILLRMAAAHQARGSLHDPDMNMPALADFRAKIGRGEVQMTSYEGQLKFGKTLLRTLERNLESQAFANALSVVEKAKQDKAAPR